MSNTHRAVIEGSVPPSMELIASGPKAFCEGALSDWITTHPLAEFQTAVILRVESESEPK